MQPRSVRLGNGQVRYHNNWHSSLAKESLPQFVENRFRLLSQHLLSWPRDLQPPSWFEPLWFPSVTLVSVLLDPSGSCLITVTSSFPSELLTVLVVSKPPSGPLTVLSLTLLLKNLTPPLRPSPWNCSISGPWFPKLKVPLLKPLPPNLSQLFLGPSGSRLSRGLTPPGSSSVPNS